MIRHNYRAGVARCRTAMIKLIGGRLMEENERPVNGPGRWVVPNSFRRGREPAATGTPEDASDRRAPIQRRAARAAVRAGRSRARAKAPQGRAGRTPPAARRRPCGLPPSGSTGSALAPGLEAPARPGPARVVRARVALRS